MSSVQCRYGKKIDDRKIETEKCSEIEERDNAHLRDFPRHLCHTDRPRQFRARELKNDPIERIEHHHDNHPRPLECHRDGLEEARIGAGIGIHNANVSTLL